MWVRVSVCLVFLILGLLLSGCVRVLVITFVWCGYMVAYVFVILCLCLCVCVCVFVSVSVWRFVRKAGREAVSQAGRREGGGERDRWICLYIYKEENTLL